MPVQFSIHNLHTSVQTQEILKGVSLVLKGGEVHAIMGPNGSGKSTLAKAIMGHPAYCVTRGKVLLGSTNVLKLDPEERAKKGIFMAFQYPVDVPGVNMFSYLRAIYSARLPKGKVARGAKRHPGTAKHVSEAKEFPVSAEEFKQIIDPILQRLHIKQDFLERSLNDGFSGGEKKKSEVVQLALLHPKVIILDETDSGLDIDALKVVAQGVLEFRPRDSIVLIITHYQRILRYIKPDFVHVMKEGIIVESGDYGLAKRLEKVGYQELKAL